MPTAKRTAVKKKVVKTVPLTDYEYAELHQCLEATLHGKSMTADDALFLIGILTFATETCQKAIG